MILNNLAKAYAESGQYEKAEEMAREAVRVAEKTGNTHLSQFMANLGVILSLEGIYILTFFRDGLVWRVGLTVEIKLRFQIQPA